MAKAFPKGVMHTEPKVSLILSTYKSERFLSNWLASITRQTIWPWTELIICANDPDLKETKILQDFELKWQGQVKILIVPREALYSSWNRCIKVAKAGYLAIANVDDLRTPDSLELQVQALDENREALFCYGSFKIVSMFPSKKGITINPINYEPVEFTRSMILGPFFMWRKTDNPAIQYFDEQFKSGGDFEFAIRLALHGKGIKLGHLLGYYLDEGSGLSTGSELQPIERTVIELRYGIFDKIDYNYLQQAKKYKITDILHQGKATSVVQFVPHYQDFIRERYKNWFEIGMDKYLRQQEKSQKLQQSTREKMKKVVKDKVCPILTILTDVIPEVPVNSKPKHEGHYGVTCSLLEGLKKVKANFNFNPNRLGEVADNVVVLSGITTVLQAIQLKRSGLIKRLLVGPNIVVRANQFEGILAYPEIDVCIVPSDWVRIAYEEDAPGLMGKVRVWYAGINEEYWQPDNNVIKSKDVLVYWKTETEEFIRNIEEKLKSYGWQPTRIRYGHYKAEEYKRLLNRSVFSVFISISESQGLALAESWAMDVPTVVWNPQKLKKHYQDEEYYSTVSSCPYLNPMAGVEWKELDQFEQFLRQAQDILPTFQPRNWVLENMTDTISAQKMLELVYNETAFK